MSEETLKILPHTVPASIAIIMDGNGRWAKKKGWMRSVGHRFGVKTVKNIIKACDRLGVKVLTLYAFSTENWKRSSEEVGAIMALVVEFLKKDTDELCANNVCMRFIGDLSRLPADTLKSIEDTIQRTKENTGLIVNIALNYGGRAELARAAKRLALKVENGELNANEIDEALFSSMLYTSDCPDPDLLIRTGGDIRISNFLLWQIAYSELYFTDVLWPDFDEQELYRAIASYQKKDRRFGGVKE